MAVTAAPDYREGHPIERRKVRFDWSHTPVHWVPDDPFSTHVINVLHLLLPTGERWFAASINRAKEDVQDAELIDAIKPFIQQESWHAWAHTMVLDHLQAQGIDTKPYTDRLERMFEHVLGDHPSWPQSLQPWWTRRRIAAIAAIEHFTAVLGHWALETQAPERHGADPVMTDLLRWHGAEEVEHRSLVFDVHLAIGGRWLQRATTMATTVPTLFGLWIAGANYLLKHDPTLSGQQKFTVREYRRAVREGKLPSLRTIFGGIPRYLSPGYNPVQDFSTQDALDYLSRSPAAQAARDAAAQGRDVKEKAQA